MKDACSLSSRIRLLAHALAAQTPNWVWVAVTGLLGSALLLLRSEPLPPWLFLPLLLLLPWMGRQRLTLLLSIALLSAMALDYALGWHQRLSVEVKALDLQGEIVGQPQQSPALARFDLRPEAETVGLLRVVWYRPDQPLRTGQCWRFRLQLRPPHGSLNPGGLDYEAWLFRQAYAAQASVRVARPCDERDPLPAASARPHFADLGSVRAVASLHALLLGERSGMTDQDWTVLRRTGTSHLFAISGLHLGLMAGFGFFLGLLMWRLLLWRVLPRQRDVGVAAAVLVACAYAYVAGFGVPVQRALLMCLLGLLAVLSGRRKQMITIWAFALVVVMALEPKVVLSAGFWLSFLAALAIILYLQAFPEQGRLRQLLGIQLYLSLVLAPLSLFFFGGVAWLGLPVNLLLVPAFGVLLPVLLGAFMMARLLHWDGPLQLMLSVLEWLWQILERLAAVPGGYVHHSAPSLALLMVVMIGLLALPLLRLRGRVLTLILLLPLLLKGPVRPPDGAFWLWVWDVGQGQSVLVQTRHHAVLYDAGPAWAQGYDAGERVVVPAMHALGVRRLDRMLISHADMDHAGGAGAVAAALPIGERLGSGGQACRAGQAWAYDGVRFEVLHPAGAQGKDNNLSCVLRVVAASERAALLSGDIERLAELELLSRQAILRADVLLVPHHGSATSSSAEFIDAVTPRLALVSAGWRNRWNFPRPEVLARYRAAQVPLFISGASGAMKVEVGGELALRAWRASRPRLWREPMSQDAAGASHRLSFMP